jgi:hypothetical protein
MKRLLTIVLCLAALLLVQRVEAQVRDQSDAVFSIVMPSAKATDVDMGRVTVGVIRDSLVRSFLSNTGVVRIRIDEISIEGGGGVFTVSGGNAPVHIPATGAHDVAFGFAPTAAGPFAAKIVVTTQVDTQRYEIRGEGMLPEIEVVAALVDFGAIPVGAVKDSTVDVLLRNLTAGPVRVARSENAGPDVQQFSILSGAAPFTLPPFGMHAMQLRFAPARTGRSSGSIAFYVDGTQDPATAALFGEGLGVYAEAMLTTDTLRASAGERITIPVRLRDRVSVQLSGASAIYTELRFRASLLVPVGATPKGRIEGDERVIPLDGLPLLPLRDDIIAEFDFMAVLGESEATELRLENSAAVGGTLFLREEPGLFILDDLCREGGTRLFDADARISLKPNHPNPFNGETVLSFQVIERAHARLLVRDAQGRIVKVLFDRFADPGSYTVRFDPAALPSGTYFSELHSGTILLRRVMTHLK